MYPMACESPNAAWLFRSPKFMVCGANRPLMFLEWIQECKWNLKCHLPRHFRVPLKYFNPSVLARMLYESYHLKKSFSKMLCQWNFHCEELTILDGDMLLIFFFISFSFNWESKSIFLNVLLVDPAWSYSGSILPSTSNSLSPSLYLALVV
jgi:hypothetical protein